MSPATGCSQGPSTRATTMRGASTSSQGCDAWVMTSCHPGMHSQGSGQHLLLLLLLLLHNQQGGAGLQPACIRPHSSRSACGLQHAADPANLPTTRPPPPPTPCRLRLSSCCALGGSPTSCTATTGALLMWPRLTGQSTSRTGCGSPTWCVAGRHLVAAEVVRAACSAWWCLLHQLGGCT